MTDSPTRFSVQADAIVKGKVSIEPREAKFALSLLSTFDRKAARPHEITVMYENRGRSEAVSASCTTSKLPNWILDMATLMLVYGFITLTTDLHSPPGGPVYELRRIS